MFKKKQRRELPDLVPPFNDTGYVAIAAGRVINAKYATATSSTQVWDCATQAAASSSKTPASKLSTSGFPALQASSAGPSQMTPVYRQPQRNPTWSSIASRQLPATTSNIVGPNPPITVVREDPPGPKQGSGKNTTQQPPKLSNELFPELPTSSAGRQKAPVGGGVSWRDILVNATQPAVPAWGTDGWGDTDENVEVEIGTGGRSAGKGKSKGKQKQTLFTLGSSPT